jgi:hypothetical protein
MHAYTRRRPPVCRRTFAHTQTHTHTSAHTRTLTNACTHSCARADAHVCDCLQAGTHIDTATHASVRTHALVPVTYVMLNITSYILPQQTADSSVRGKTTQIKGGTEMDVSNCTSDIQWGVCIPENATTTEVMKVLSFYAHLLVNVSHTHCNVHSRLPTNIVACSPSTAVDNPPFVAVSALLKCFTKNPIYYCTLYSPPQTMTQFLHVGKTGYACQPSGLLSSLK